MCKQREKTVGFFENVTDWNLHGRRNVLLWIERGRRNSLLKQAGSREGASSGERVIEWVLKREKRSVKGKEKKNESKMKKRDQASSAEDLVSISLKSHHEMAEQEMTVEKSEQSHLKRFIWTFNHKPEICVS